MQDTMAPLILFTTACLLLIWIPPTLQCKGKKPPENKELIALKKEQEAHREKELRMWCDVHCVSEWASWSQCDSACGRGNRYRERYPDNSEWCNILDNFECTHSMRQDEVCNSGCSYGGFASSYKCTGCPYHRTGGCCETEIFCSSIFPPRGGNIQANWPARPDSRIQFSCNTGFNLVGDDTTTCQRSGYWTSYSVKCEEIRCNQPEVNDNVKILNAMPGYAFGEQVIYGCEDGYTLHGPGVRTCQKGANGNGAWSGYDVQCKPIKCPTPQIPLNGKIFNLSTSFQYGDIVNYDCNEGYKLVGSDALQCLATGSWYGHQPKCEVITCEPPFVPRHGQVRIRKEGIKAFALFECDDGYRLEPNIPSLTCMTDGIWNGTEPRCIAASCGNPGSPQHGVTLGGVFTYGNKVTFQCDRGYEMKGGSKTIECQSNTQWSGAMPTCEACPTDFYMDRDKCAKCPVHSFTASNASTSIVQCLCDQENGFNGPPGGPCEETFCTKLTAPGNGQITDCGNKVGVTCSFSCDDGYMMERGSTKRTCQNTGDWDGTQPFCVPCRLNTYKSGERTCSPCPLHSHTNQSGQTLLGCICDKGYEGPAGGPCSDVDECQTKQGKGPCSDTCENNNGGYHCRCSIPGYKIDPQNILTCTAEKQCKNLTRDNAPENGGVVCHWFFEENSQHCTTKCNPGYEMPSRTNDYETCGPATGYTWSYQMENITAVLTPCVPEIFPDFRLEADSAYFTAACENLTEAQKTAAKQEFADRLNSKGVCSKGRTKICNIKDMAIICGRVERRRKRRGVDVVEHSVDFAYNVSALKFEEQTTDCHGKICPMFRIPARHCDQYCKPMYKRYLRASVEYAKRRLTDIHQGTNKLQDLSFKVDTLTFIPEDDGFRASDVIKECPEGMVAINDLCVPCKAGTYLNEDKTDCVKCPHNTYQDKDRQSTCIPCTSLGPGYSTHGNGSTTCQMCPEGRWGDNCVNRCNCAHGDCSPFDGSCICSSGWEGPRCERDINSCIPGSCYPGVTCVDEPPPGTGFSCGPCPAGYHGDGFDCAPLRQKRSVGLMAFEL